MVGFIVSPAARGRPAQEGILSDSGIFRAPHLTWQRGNVLAATAYFREVLAADPTNTRVRALHEGLLDVLDPTRRVLRLQRELSHGTGTFRAERRAWERRSGSERRQKDLRIPEILDRRSGVERRTGRDRRKR